MSAATADDNTPLADSSEPALIKADPTDDEFEDSKNNDKLDNNNNINKHKHIENDTNYNSNSDIDENEMPQIKIDKRISNVIQRRHSADLKNIDSKIEIKITNPTDSDKLHNIENDIKEKDSKYFEGSDNEEDDLKMLGPVKQIVKTQSLDTGLSKQKEDGLLLSDELQTLSTKKASVVTIEETDNVSGKKTVQTAVVPPRDVIERYPFFSTPLTVESTNNAFRDFMSRLTDMGFRDQAEAALVHTNAESIEAAVAFITEDPDRDRLWHRFKLPPTSTTNALIPQNSNNALLPSDNNIHNHSHNNDNINNDTNSIHNQSANDIDIHITDETLCDACGMAYIEHLIDHRGEQIVSKNEALYGDLHGRVSMSVATLKQRQDQRQELDEIKKRSVAILNSLSEVDDLDTTGNLDILSSSSGGAGGGGDSLALGSEGDGDGGGGSGSGIRSNKVLISEKIQSEIDNVMKEDIEKKKSIDGPTEQCQICFDDKSVNDFYRAPCGHNYCKECLQTHYKVKTKDGDVLKVSCIDPKCDREIPEEECRQFLTDPEILAKYEKFRREKLLMLNPNARFCPKPDCSGHMIGSRWNPRLQCPVCSEEVCFNCSQTWHGYFVGCNQNVDIGYSRWAINKDVQKCPKCRIRIEKDEGCNHMTCQSCHYEFCWICRGPYSSSHYDPWNIFGCPGAQFTPRFCRCPSCFPRWLNRILILICFVSIVVPLVITAGTLWLVVLFLVFCIRCDAKCDIDPCDCFD